MDKTLSDYDQSLEELERQREHLELVMKKMGQEWEESGAGIGWMALQQSTGNSESDNVVPTDNVDNEVHETDSLDMTIRTSPSPPLQPNDPLEYSPQPSSTLELRDPYPPTPLSPESQQQQQQQQQQNNTRNSLDEGLHVIIEPKNQQQDQSQSSLNLLMQQATPSSNGPSADYLQSLLNVNEALLAQSLTSSSSSSSTNHEQPSSSSSIQEQSPSHLHIHQHHRRNHSQTKEELHHFMTGFPLDDATTSILSPPITPEESYSTIRASCLSRNSSLAKSAVRPSTSHSTSFQQQH